MEGPGAVGAHAKVMKAQQALAAGRIEDAQVLFEQAARRFKALSADTGKDPTTAQALAVLADFNASRAKECKRLRSSHKSNKRDSQSSASASSLASSQRKTSTPPSPLPTTKTSTGKDAPTTGKAMFKVVQKRYRELQELMTFEAPRESDETDETSAKDELNEPVSNEELLKQALGESYSFAKPLANQRASLWLASEGNEVVQAKIAQLEEKVVVLTKENMNLTKELNKLRRKSMQKKEEASLVDELKEEFRKKFALLKLAMQHFEEASSQGDEDGRRKLLEKKLKLALSQMGQFSKELETERARRMKAERNLAQTQSTLQALQRENRAAQ